ncbi:hypothetical protein Tdes44962_MAKER00021 [Teratosphaeria destructans]|uniref:Uncharacterized protein n=1 Tax=Teratosphaeria destructans TaxID=418781 RepID=A0A9W7W859_9PEZI|nr:hypothetical protein Tdes44962_MAKER00021 [Teratosphaeria destructans]
MRLRPPFGKRSQTLVEDDSKAVKVDMPSNSAGNGSSSRKQPRRAATSPALQLHQRDTVQKQSKKRIMQDFFRSLRPSNAAARQHPAKAQDHRSRVSKTHASSSRRNSRHALPHDLSRSRSRRSFDISDDVLNRLLGPPKSVKEVGGRDSIQSDQFLLKQRIKASSRKASANGTLASSGLTQAQRHRRVLSAEEVEQLLSGTSCFSVVDGRPRVTSQGDDDVSGADWSRLDHETFGLCTLDGRVSRARATKGDTQEVPNMLSANGLDPGTVGFEHFLQVPLADSNALSDELDCFQRRRLLVNEPDQLGLRELNVEALIDRLVELSDLRVLQHEKVEDGRVLLSGRRIDELGEDLFRRLVDAELGISAAGTGSVTIGTQVEALQKVLNEEEVWYNFSQAVWRLRVGELLFVEQDDLSRSNQRETPSDRDLLLLQITLAAELLVRLDALHDLAEHHESSPEVSEDDREVISVVPTLKVQWDLVLAQRFLDNLALYADVRDGTNKTTNRASLFSANSFATAKTSAPDSEPAAEPVFQPKSAEKHLDGLVYFAKAICWPHAREVKDLLVPTSSAHDTVGEEVKGLQPEERRVSHLSGLSVYMTPLSSPTIIPQLPDLPAQYAKFAARTDDGSDASPEQKPCKLPARSRVISEHKVQLQVPGLPQVGDAYKSMGWLSRSWLSGLVLPGDSAGHLLLGALIENSPDALRVLGHVAYLQDGFQYAGYMYWSKKNVLARVLAPNKGVRECMGWISMPIERMLEGSKIKDGWVRLEVEGAPSRDLVRSRIQNPQAVASDSDPLCGLETGKLQAGDFVWPLDGPPVMGNEVKYHGLSFRERSISGRRLSSATDLTKQLMAEGSSAAPGQKKREGSMAKVTFGSPINSRLAKLELLLLYDVQFIASYPCYPQPARSPPSSRPLSIINRGSKAASSVAGSEDLASTDSVRAADTTQPNAHSSGSTFNLKDVEKELPRPPAHALHINYTFEVVPVATLLSASAESRSRAVSRAEERPKTAVAEEVVVLDCRGTEDLELLARAWCAKVGENALVGKSGRTCLACCVREARALGVCVVIRT